MSHPAIPSRGNSPNNETHLLHHEQQSPLRTLRPTNQQHHNRSLSSHQTNNVGADFVKHILNPPKPASHPDPPTFLYSQLTQIQFPPNVKILPDRQLEKLKQQKLAAEKGLKATIQKRQKESELLQNVHNARFEQKVIL